MTSETKFPSTFSVDNFSSTNTLTPNQNKLKGSEKLELGEYDPYEHRNHDHPNTFNGALMHLLKTSLGTGILAVPIAFKSSGLVVGLIGTVIIGALCTHTVTLLVSASLKMCKLIRVPKLSFAETVETVFQNGPKKIRPFSTFARLFVDVALILTYVFSNSVYAVFVATTLKELAQVHIEEAKTLDFSWYMIALMIPLLFLCQIRPLKFLVPFSSIANATMFTAFAISFYYMFGTIDQIDIRDRHLVTGFDGMPKFVSTLVFAMEGIGAIMPLENSMKDNKFLGCPGVLYIAMSTIITVYASVGFVGYFVYGDGTHPSIISNLPPNDVLSQVARGCIAIAVFLTWLLQFYVPMEIVWRNVKEFFPKNWHNLAQIAIRGGTCIFAIYVGIIVPNLGAIIQFVGAIFFSTLGLFVPAVIDIVVKWEDGFGFMGWILIKNILIMSFSIFALIAGSADAYDELMNGIQPMPIINLPNNSTL